MSETMTKKREKEIRDREIEDLRKVANTDAGQRFLRRVFARAHMHETSFVQGSSETMTFREGERNIGLWLLHELSEAAPTLLLKTLIGKGTDDDG